MANEIQVSVQYAVQNGSLVDGKTLTFQADQALARKQGGTVQNIPTTAAGTALVFAAGVTTVGIAYFFNLDPTNYIEVGIQSGGVFFPLVRLKGGAVGKKESALFRISPGVAVFARANSAAADLEFGVLND